MMRSDTAANDRVPMAMTAYLRMLLNPNAHEVAPRFATLVVGIASHECGFGCRLIAAPARWHEHDRGEEIVIAKSRQQDRRRHLGHSQFHNK